MGSVSGKTNGIYYKINKNTTPSISGTWHMTGHPNPNNGCSLSLSITLKKANLLTDSSHGTVKATEYWPAGYPTSPDYKISGNFKKIESTSSKYYMVSTGAVNGKTTYIGSGTLKH